MANRPSSHPFTRSGSGLEPTGDPYPNLMVVHASRPTASHVLVIDPDLTELERIGQLLGAQGYKVTLSSALLDLDSLKYIDPGVLLVRPTASGFRDWRDYLVAMKRDGRFTQVPVVFVAVRMAHQAAMARSGVQCISWPWRPFDLLTLVDSLMVRTMPESILDRGGSKEHVAAGIEQRGRDLSQAHGG